MLIREGITGLCACSSEREDGMRAPTSMSVDKGRDYRTLCLRAPTSMSVGQTC